MNFINLPKSELKEHKVGSQEITNSVLGPTKFSRVTLERSELILTLYIHDTLYRKLFNKAPSLLCKKRSHLQQFSNLQYSDFKFKTIKYSKN